MSFTVRFVTDTGIVEIRDAYRISENGDNLIITTVGERTRHDARQIRHVDVFWVKEA